MPSTAKPHKTRKPDRERRCRRGHVMDHVDPRGRFVCRICQTRWRRAWQARRTKKRLAARHARLTRCRPKIRQTDRVWAAGLFEGEGTITIRSAGTKPYTRPCVSMASTDKAVVAFFQARWPGRLRTWIPNSKNGVARRAWEWMLCTNDPVECFLLDMRFCWQTQRVRTKAKLLLEEIRDKVSAPRSEAVKQRSAERLKQMRVLNRRGLRRPRRVVGVK